ncbi:propanediol dehydratase large subunit [Mycolicibacterium mageritense DSM 44476 = CIP 104973]|uniref:Glycerol dehydratase large subunit n=1 Tax=Mycolicibacterium mageritense TaxID=53462 RepID=A0ABN5YID5_MYCME|nr:propanediol/glycerol family dehydratase large subunit [Mycolicibacterium mageritense]MCC9179899.1 propanediol/glycerol family dehydratase large subunit [Mycolicibacterium mageritense]BBX37839.1 glycerol dehydratase large subunit [Mycolicibacterium mageritense]CDO25492.1 glycerol dehydratase large subunit [Mycolicibacterium mageritense DSM 44476 = CIP 104973]
MNRDEKPTQTGQTGSAMLDGLAEEQPDWGLIALHSPYDPEPSVVIRDGRVVELDGVPEERFDQIDTFIALRGIDVAIAEQAMAIPDIDLARMLVDLRVPRAEVSRLAGGLTPAKLAAVVRLLEPHELMTAVAKMRVRQTPSIQAHVTNRLDDPLLLAADAATAVARGFRELETTVPVFPDAASNAVALLVGSQVAHPGAITQCSVEEAFELKLGVRGLTTYAETISIYGTDQVFEDGDDTPWSKTFLISAYASRGIKVRVTSGAGSEVLMGAAQSKSMLYLESRCVSLARAMGVQGVQNGGIDGASVAGSVPAGFKGLLAENLMVMVRGMESCSGNDTLVSESDIRRTARSLPLILTGSDFIFSGFGSVPRYDNMFGPSNFNGEDVEDYLLVQRDWEVDGGLRSVDRDTLINVRRRAAAAVQAVYRHLDLFDFSDEQVEAAALASGSKDLPEANASSAQIAASAIERRQLTAIDVVRALAETGFEIEAERVLEMVKHRVVGDYLQPAAIFDEQMNLLSAHTDPNTYAGPGTGYRMSAHRRSEVTYAPRAVSFAALSKNQIDHATPDQVVEHDEAVTSHDPRDVVVGVSPAFAKDLWVGTNGVPIRTMLREILAGIEEQGCHGRIVRIRHSIDLGQIGLSAARLAGSGIGVGLQAKGTVLIHRRDLPPLANLELLSTAPLITTDMYRTIGLNAGGYVKNMAPRPIRNPYTEEAITARYHALTVALVAIERAASDVNARPTTIEWKDLM